jgi:hypothetical protein
MAVKTYADIDASGNKIVNVATPTTGSDGANKTYVDFMASGGPKTAKIIVGSTGIVSVGQKNAFYRVVSGGTVTKWRIWTDQTTTTTVNILKSSSFPTFSTLGSFTLTNGRYSTAVVSWVVATDDILDLEVISNTSGGRITIELEIT